MCLINNKGYAKRILRISALILGNPSYFKTTSLIPGEKFIGPAPAIPEPVPANPEARSAKDEIKTPMKSLSIINRKSSEFDPTVMKNAAWSIMSSETKI